MERAVVDRLYEVFAHHGLPPAMTFCDDCDDADDEAALHGDLRSLPADVVEKYAWDAIHHTGDASDFRHFVPRIYELLGDGRLCLDVTECALGRLAMATWRSWPAAEVEAMEATLDAMWADAMDMADPPIRTDDLVCGLGLAYGRLPPQVSTWMSGGGAFATQRLAEFVVANAAALPEGRLGDAWWTDDRAAMTAVHAWLVAPQVVEALRDATRATTDDLLEEAMHLLDGDPSPVRALDATFGADPDAAAPSRGEWDRG